MADQMRASIEGFIMTFISDELGIPLDDIDVSANLGSYGLESVAASKLMGILEKKFGLPLSEVLVFEFPTIAALSTEIGKLAAARVD